MALGVAATTSTGYRLLDAFRQLFDGKLYRHRNPLQGDAVAMELFEDLYNVAQARMTPAAAKYCTRVNAAQRVLNPRNRVMGSGGRRGDGTFGDPVPNMVMPPIQGYNVRRGWTATCEIGVESKFLSTAMGKQIGSRADDLVTQAEYFRKHGTNPLTVAIVSVNHAPIYCSVEGEHECTSCHHIDVMTTVTDGKKKKHPAQEAQAAIAKIQTQVAPKYDRVLLLDYSATNMPPYVFAWQSQTRLMQTYHALLTWLAAEYEHRF